MFDQLYGYFKSSLGGNGSSSASLEGYKDAFAPGAGLPPGLKTAGDVNKSAVETVGKYKGMGLATVVIATRIQRCWRSGVVSRALKRWSKREFAALLIQRTFRGWVGKSFVRLYRVVAGLAALAIQRRYVR